MKSKNLFDHYKEPICKIWFDEKGYMTATEIGFELIRCKDCKFYQYFGERSLCAHRRGLNGHPCTLDYCSRAERKEE